MAPATQSLNAQNPNSKKVREVHEFDATPSTKGPTTPRTSTYLYSSWISSSPATTTTTISSPSPSSSSAAAATAQKQQLQPLDVTPSVISNFVVTGTDASFVGFTTPAGATGDLLPVSSASPSPSPAPEPESKPKPERDSKPEAESGAPATTAQEGTAGQNRVTTTTPQAGAHDDLTHEEEKKEEDEAEAAKKSKIKRQTAAARSVCSSWLGVDGRLRASEYKKEEKKIGGKVLWKSKRE